MHTQRDRIRMLNDELRQHHQGGIVVLTNGVRSLDTRVLGDIDCAIASFTAFDATNDPYDEHDFGLVEVGGYSVVFKIDYYDLDLLYQSTNPSDPDLTRRVMTIMMADEY